MSENTQEEEIVLPTQQEVTAVIAGAFIAERESGFVDSVRFDAQLIEGTRYKYRLSEAYDR